MKRFHFILFALSINVLLLSINRFASFTLTTLEPYEFLRWVDINAMISIPLLTILLYYFLQRNITGDNPFQKSALPTFIGALFVTGVFLFGAGSGDHEITNYLNTRFCDRGQLQTPMCNIISYNDDEFSHYVYYLGFILMNVALLLFEYKIPRKSSMNRIDVLLIFLNSLLIGFGIFANLAFEAIGLDLLFFGSVMVFSVVVLIIKRERISHFPVASYFAISYTLGVVGTFLYKFLVA